MPNAPTIPISLVRESHWLAWLEKSTPEVRRWIGQTHFKPKPGSFCLLPEGKSLRVVCVCENIPGVWSIAQLPDALPPGAYHVEGDYDAATADALHLGWLLGSYRFDRYKASARKTDAPTLVDMRTGNPDFVRLTAEALGRARELINLPANDLGPEELSAAARKIAERHAMQFTEIVGKDLLTQNYPAIYEVGKGSSRAPRLIDLRWGESGPRVTLVGKGVCFDSGGLDIKPSSGMKLMKKDMGGAACVLALAELIVAARLPVRLRVLIPAVENSISGDAYRPFDIINTRKGLTVEVGNTDAEGRLILCDALYEADSEHPDLLIDCATLTGAARTALGTEIPALFSPDDALAEALVKHGTGESDPLWRLPLWRDYRDMLKSNNADINSAPDSGYAGAITAALYLEHFVVFTRCWAHIDMAAWNFTKRPGRPVGGEAMAVRAIYAFIHARYRQV